MSEKTANPWTVWRDWILLLSALAITYIAASVYWSATATHALTTARSALHGTHWIEPAPSTTLPTTPSDATSLLLEIRSRLNDQALPAARTYQIEQLDGLLPLPPTWVAAAQKSLTANADLIPLAQQAATAGPLRLDRTPTPGAHPDNTPANRVRVSLLHLIPLLTEDAILHPDATTALARLETAYQLIEKLRIDQGATLSDKSIFQVLESDINDNLHYIASQLKLPTDPAASHTTRQLALSLISQRLAAANRPPPIGSYPDLLGYQRLFSDSLPGSLAPLSNSIMAAAYNEIAYLESAAPGQLKKVGRSRSTATGHAVDLMLLRVAANGGMAGRRDYSRISNLRAALALSVSLYQADTGHYPSTLDELVPTYLPEIPTDPESDPPTKIQYVLRGNRPLISLGTGPASNPTTLPSDYLGTYQYSINPITYFDLLPLPRPTRPLTTPSPPP